MDSGPCARAHGKRLKQGELLFGTVDTWLVWKLTGGKVHVTDRTNASRTMLYNIRTLDWDEKLLQALDIPRGMLPEVRDSSEIYGYTNIQGVDVPVAGIAGDQQAALFGQACFAPGDAKNTYGTGCFLLMNTGDETCQSKNGLAHHRCHRPERRGASTRWRALSSWAVRSSSGCGTRCTSSTTAATREYYAQKVQDNGGVYVVPAFTGPGRALLGYVRPGCHSGHHPRHHPEPHHPGGSRNPSPTRART